MSLSRKEQLAFCQICKKKGFDPKKGIICSITNEQATFESSCPDFEEDQLSVKRHERIEKQKEDMPNTGGFVTPAAVETAERKIFNGGIIGGILMIIGGIAWIIGGLAINRIFFYPIFLIIAGIISLFKGLAKKAEEMKQPETSQILDDSDDLEVL